jgi:hypothetical protein
VKEDPDDARSAQQAYSYWRRLHDAERHALVATLFNDDRPCFEVLTSIVGEIRTPRMAKFLSTLNRLRVRWQMGLWANPGDSCLFERKRWLGKVPVVGLEPFDPEHDGRLSPDFVALCRLLGPKGIVEHYGDPIDVSDAETRGALTVDGVWKLEGIGDDGLLYRWIVFQETEVTR